MLYPLIIGLIVLAILITAFAVLASHRAEQRAHVARIVAGDSGTRGKKNAGDNRDKRREELAKKLNEESSDRPGTRTGVIRQKMRAAGLAPDLRTYWSVSVVLAVIVAVPVYWTGYPLFVVIMVSVVGLMGLPPMILRFLIKRRQKKFLDEFADALEAMVRLLKSGMPVSEAIAMVGREFSGPVGEEMAQMHDQQRIGITLPGAALYAAKRMHLTEMQMFATAVSIQQQTGTSLSEVLSNLATVVRARHRLKRKVATLSAEAISSAAIIGAMPPLVAGGLYVINPGYMEIMFTTQTGNILLTASVTLMGIGVFVMRQMINFKF